MNREQKAATIERIAGQIEASEAVFAVDFRGISVPQAAELRTKLREADASFRVVKNSLTERAADQAGAESLKTLLEGPTALTFVQGDAALAAKAIADYARTTQLLPFKGGLLGGEPLDAEQVRAISRLPARDVLYAQLVGVVASPVTGLVRTLGSLIGGLAVALGQVQERKQAEEPPAPPEQTPSEQKPAEEAPGDATAAAETAQAETPAGEQQAAEAEAQAVADPSGDEAQPAEQAEAQAAEQAETQAPAAEVPTESAEEAAPAAEQAEPETDPAPDNQADASTQADETAEATKEDK